MVVVEVGWIAMVASRLLRLGGKERKKELEYRSSGKQRKEKLLSAFDDCHIKKRKRHRKEKMPLFIPLMFHNI